LLLSLLLLLLFVVVVVGIRHSLVFNNIILGTSPIIFPYQYSKTIFDGFLEWYKSCFPVPIASSTFRHDLFGLLLENMIVHCFQTFEQNLDKQEKFSLLFCFAIVVITDIVVVLIGSSSTLLLLLLLLLRECQQVRTIHGVQYLMLLLSLFLLLQKLCNDETLLIWLLSLLLQSWHRRQLLLQVSLNLLLKALKKSGTIIVAIIVVVVAIIR